MRYEDLRGLIRHSRSSREYFLTLTPQMQMRLHEHNDYIHSAFELRMRVELIERSDKLFALSEGCTGS